ncbi:hypothetical protein BGX31_003620 [Mortierella sp. GBA43]|nr:hypothetical protein BGX31_003620 [Mortierella sp. GBA43]
MSSSSGTAIRKRTSIAGDSNQSVPQIVVTVSDPGDENDGGNKNEGTWGALVAFFESEPKETTETFVNNVVKKLKNDMKKFDDDQMWSFLKELGWKRRNAFPTQDVISAICFVLLKIYDSLEALKNTGGNIEVFTMSDIQFEQDNNGKINVIVKTNIDEERRHKAGDLYRANAEALKAVMESVLVDPYGKAIPESVRLNFDVLKKGGPVVPQRLKSDLEKISNVEVNWDFRKAQVAAVAKSITGSTAFKVGKALFVLIVLGDKVYKMVQEVQQCKQQ